MAFLTHVYCGFALFLDKIDYLPYKGRKVLQVLGAMAMLVLFAREANYVEDFWRITDIKGDTSEDTMRLQAKVMWAYSEITIFFANVVSLIIYMTLAHIWPESFC